MRDQAVLVRNAVKNEIPAFALIGKDKSTRYVVHFQV